MQLDKGQWVVIGGKIGLVADIRFDGGARYVVHIVNPEDGTTLMELDQKSLRIRDVSVEVEFGDPAIRPATLQEIPECRRCPALTAAKLGIDIGEEAAKVGLKGITLPSGRLRYIAA